MCASARIPSSPSRAVDLDADLADPAGLAAVEVPMADLVADRAVVPVADPVARGNALTGHGRIKRQGSTTSLSMRC